MKKLNFVFLLLSIMCFLSLQAQQKEFMSLTTQEYPEFPEGNKAFAKYLKANLKYPEEAKRLGVEGKVFLEFIVEKDGTITNVKTIKGIGHGCDEEAIKVMQNSPKWKQHKVRGEILRQKMNVPIVFKLNQNSTSLEVSKNTLPLPPPPKKQASDERIFLSNPTQPTFPGGNKAFAKYTRENLKYPSIARKAGIEGKVFVEFIVEKDGSITNVKTIKGLGYGCDKVAEEIFKNSPKWDMGLSRGEAQRVKMCCPIVFKLGYGSSRLKPLIFLNGKEISQEEFEKISEGAIDSLVILREVDAVAKYGKRTKDGVIEIYT